MKLILIRMFLAIVFIALPAPLVIAEASSDPAVPDRMSTLRDRLQGMARELELTEEQREKLRPILQAEMDRLRKLQADPNLSRRARLRRLKEIRREVTPKVKEILTPEQFKKWESMRAEARSDFRAARRRNRP